MRTASDKHSFDKLVQEAREKAQPVQQPKASQQEKKPKRDALGHPWDHLTIE